MDSTNESNTQKPVEESSNTSERALPTTPFPRTYVLSTFNDRQEALRAAEALRQAGFDSRDIYIMTYEDFAEAIDREQTLPSFLQQGDLDVYQDAARDGDTILAVHLANEGQMEKVRDLLAPHHAHHVRYVATLAVWQLLP
jgi:hypothetical protein